MDTAAKFQDAQQRASRVACAKVNAGEMDRQPCEVCGSLPTHGHHEDYGKPLDVVWLCPVHHAMRHAAINAARFHANTAIAKTVADARAREEAQKRTAAFADDMREAAEYRRQVTVGRMVIQAMRACHASGRSYLTIGAQQTPGSDYSI